MDEAAFMRAIADSPNETEVLERFAEWLIEQGDRRGEYLRLELERQETESRLRDLEHRLFAFTHSGMRSTWLDRVMPLEIRSPHVGRFYAQPEPQAEPYVEVGDIVTPETVVGMVEVMKIFNEIVAGVSGTISEILVNNEDNVEFDQLLFRVARPQPLLSGG